MRKTELKKQSLLVLFGLIIGWIISCAPKSKEDRQAGQEIHPNIVLMLEDSLVHDFLSQRKATLKYLDDNAMPVTIDFSGRENKQGFSIVIEREALELVYSDNSQSRYSYLLDRGDSVQIGLDERKPWLKTMNRQSSIYDDNLELLRNRELYQSNYTKLQDFHFLWQANFDSPTPVDFKKELVQSRKQAIESGNQELSWLDSLRSVSLIADKTAAFYATKLRFELAKLHFFAEEDGVFDLSGALDHYLLAMTDSSKYLQSVYLDEFADFLLAQIKPDDRFHPDSLGTNPGPFGKRMLFKFLQQSLPRLASQKADQWLNTYGSQLENKAQADFLKASIGNLRGTKPDMDLMGIENRRMSFEELLDQKKGNYLYVDLWEAWCIPCIKAFPALRKLHDQYKDQGIEVIHLSLDRNHKFWEEVVRKYDIAFPERSFITMNLAESDFLEQLEVASIPRYLVFDPNGKLVHPHAPGPDGEEIKVLFNELLGGIGE